MPRPKSDDPKRNAGISLTQAEIDKLAAFAKAAKLEGNSAVVSMLIQKYLPNAWWDLELQKSKSKQKEVK